MKKYNFSFCHQFIIIWRFGVSDTFAGLPATGWAAALITSATLVALFSQSSRRPPKTLKIDSEAHDVPNETKKLSIARKSCILSS